VSNRLGRAPDLDLDVIAKAVQALHQLALGKVGEIAAHQAGNFGLRQTHPVAGFLLGQAKTPDCASDFDDQAGLDFELFGIGQTQVEKHVAGTGFNFDAVKNALCHVVAPLPSARLP